MSIINMLFYILVGLVLGARAITLSQLAQKVKTLEQQLEYGGKRYQTLHYTNSKYSCVDAVVAIVSLIALLN